MNDDNTVDTTPANIDDVYNLLIEIDEKLDEFKHVSLGWIYFLLVISILAS